MSTLSPLVLMYLQQALSIVLIFQVKKLHLLVLLLILMVPKCLFLACKELMLMSTLSPLVLMYLQQALLIVLVFPVKKPILTVLPSVMMVPRCLCWVVVEMMLMSTLSPLVLMYLQQALLIVLVFPVKKPILTVLPSVMMVPRCLCWVVVEMMLMSTLSPLVLMYLQQALSIVLVSQVKKLFRLVLPSVMMVPRCLS